MNLDPLPPIPSPPAHYWRQFCVKVVPYLAFGVVLALTLWLWGRNLANPLLQGTAEGLEADVASPKAGRLTQLNVVPYQEVKAGEVIAVVDPVNPAVLSSTLALIRAEMEQIRIDAGFRVGDKLRYAQLRLDWMVQQADLLAVGAQWRYATNEFQRVAKLFAEKIADQQVYDVAKRDYEQADQLVKEKTIALEAAGQTLRQLDPTAPESPSIKAALAVAEARLRMVSAELQPIILTAPISGRVIKLVTLAGSTVAPAAPIVTIASAHVDRIIGFVGLPLRIEPRLGMEVEIRSRGLNRAVGRARITYVGPRIELFNAPIRLRTMEAAQARGLPIAASVPPNMGLRPGELVDLCLLMDARREAPSGPAVH